MLNAQCLRSKFLLNLVDFNYFLTIFLEVCLVVGRMLEVKKGKRNKYVRNIVDFNYFFCI
jgi:hypothetical protein